MHVGMNVHFTGLDPEQSDAALWHDMLALADCAEPAGLDSVWVSEHHFARYHMCPNPLQFLTWMAARTTRVKLGSLVVVLPWHDPVRVAEEISVLDIMSNGRAVVGFGRGLGAIEFDGFRAKMGESRERFVEYAEAVMQGLETGVMEYEGQLYTQPRVEIRPMPTLSFAGRTYASAVSPESAKIMAKMGFGLLLIAQKPWDTTVREVAEYAALYEELNGSPAPRPVLANMTNIHQDSERALELRELYGIGYAQAAADHYEFTSTRISEEPGYEYYAKFRENILKHGLDKFVRFLAELQIAGTPEDVVDMTVERVRALDACGVVNTFCFGGMPYEIGRAQFELYVDKVLPRLKGIDAFRELGSVPAYANA